MTVLADLRTRPLDAPLPATVRRRDVGTAAWFGLLADGVLRPLWHDVARRADVPETPALRAAALAGLVPPRAVVGRLSAAWVHAGGPAPPRVDLLFAPGARRTDPHPLRIAVQTRLSPGEIVVVGPVRVTAVQRTGLDVARWAPSADADRLLPSLGALGFDAWAAQVELARLGAVRGARHARARLARCGRPAAPA